jgi:acetyltransferase-like isoleucine patch superfamily enzyme
VMAILTAIAARIGARLLRFLHWASDRTQEEWKRAQCNAHETAVLFPESTIINSLGRRENIQIGDHSLSRGECKLFYPSGKIRVGSYCYIGNHARIWSAVGVTIGDRVLISHSVNIHDHSGHPTSAQGRHLQTKDIFAGCETNMEGVAMAPITVEDDVWIGFSAIILKGVKIGRGAIIGAATVITKDVPAFAIMVGNPARQVGTAGNDFSLGD